MKVFGKENHRRSHFEVQAAATESQAVISYGEKILNRAHKLAQEVEKNVQHALHVPAKRSFDPAPPPPR